MISDCPLCRSQFIEVTEPIDVTGLVKLYNGMLGDSIAQEFSDYRQITLFHCKDCDLKFFSPAVTGSEEFYEKLQRYSWYYLENKEEYNTAFRFITDADTVLEVGCGNGAFFRKIKPKSYVGLELSRKAKRTAEKQGAKIVNETIEVHAASHEVEYNVVCAFQVLEHVSDVRGFVSASLDCLKPEGLLILSLPSSDSFVSQATNNLLNVPPHHVTWWSDKSLNYLASSFGLKIIQLEHESLSDIHRPWYASVLIETAINRYLNRPKRIIDPTWLGKAIHLFSMLSGHVAAPWLKRKTQNVRGHSVTLVCRKGLHGPG